MVQGPCLARLSHRTDASFCLIGSPGAARSEPALAGRIVPRSGHLVASGQCSVFVLDASLYPDRAIRLYSCWPILGKSGMAGRSAILAGPRTFWRLGVVSTHAIAGLYECGAGLSSFSRAGFTGGRILGIFLRRLALHREYRSQDYPVRLYSAITVVLGDRTM